MRWRTKSVGHSFSRNLRALARSSSCSSVKPISILPGAGIPKAVEPHDVAEMRPQALRPGRIGGLAPLGRGSHFGRGKMIERQVTLCRAGPAVAAGAQGAGHGAECRNMLLVVPLVEIALVFGGDIHCDDRRAAASEGAVRSPGNNCSPS